MKNVLVVILAFVISNAVQAYTEFVGAPNTTQTLVSTAPGVFEFDEQFTWRDENGGGHDQTVLGTWASRTWSYKAYQYNGIGNVVDISTPGYYVEYCFLIPVDQSALGNLTVDVVSRGIIARATNNPDNWYSQNSLFVSGSSFEQKSASVPMVSWDTTVPGQVKFYLVFENNNNGGIDSFHVTATTASNPTFIDFESPVYTADTLINGQDNWTGPSDMVQVKYDSASGSQVLDFSDAVGYAQYASRSLNTTYSTGKVHLNFLMKWLWDLSGEVILKDSSNNWVFSFGVGKNYLNPGPYWQIGEGPAGYVFNVTLPPTSGPHEFIEISIDIDLDTNVADVSWGEIGQPKTTIFTNYALASTANIAKIDIGNAKAAAQFDDIRVNFPTCHDMLDEGLSLLGDINSDCHVNVNDLKMLADQWLKCTDPGRSGCEHAIGSINTLKIVKTQQSIDVDGILSDWPADLELVWLDKVYEPTVTDIQEAKFATRWSSSTSKVYLAVIVKDTQPQLEDAPEFWNSSDRIEVFSQGNPVGGIGWGESELFNVAQQYLVGPKLSGGEWATWGSRAPIAADAGFEYAIASNGSETIYEIGVTLFDTGGITTTPLTLAAGMTIGFDVVVDSKNAAGQFGMLAENMMTGKWNDAGKFQHYTLVNTLPSQLCGEWGYIGTDLNHDCSVNFLDIAKIAQSWLQCIVPEGQENCVGDI